MKTTKINKTALLACAFAVVVFFACEKTTNDSQEAVLQKTNNLKSANIASQTMIQYAEELFPDEGIRIPTNLPEYYQSTEESGIITVPKNYTLIAETPEGIIQYEENAVINIDCHCINGSTVCGSIGTMIMIHPVLTFPPKVPNINPYQIIHNLTDTNKVLIFYCVKNGESCSEPQDPCSVVFGADNSTGKSFTSITRGVFIRNNE